MAELGVQRGEAQLWAEYDRSSQLVLAALAAYEQASAVADGKFREYLRACWARDRAHAVWRGRQQDQPPKLLALPVTS